MRKILLACTALLSVPVAFSTPALARQDEPVAVPDRDVITVTARKREESLFEVPGAISVVGGGQIEALRLQDARDALSLTPNAFLQENNAGTARDISIRGVSTPTLFAEPGVALYVDDVYASGFITYPTRFYDIERIEVLRGPQGSLYGAKRSRWCRQCDLADAVRHVRGRSRRHARQQ
jgi:iron complex outermembrane receptor protein